MTGGYPARVGPAREWRVVGAQQVGVVDRPVMVGAIRRTSRATVAARVVPVVASRWARVDRSHRSNPVLGSWSAARAPVEAGSRSVVRVAARQAVAVCR